MRRILIGFVVIVLLIVVICGLRGQRTRNRPFMIFWDMDFNPRYNAQGQSDFFADGDSQRLPPKGTVAFGGADYFSDAGSPTQHADFLQEDDAFYRGKDEGGGWIKKVPEHKDVPVTMDTLKRGQQRYDIYCAVCHGGTGEGDGIIGEYGLAGIASLQDKRIREQADGKIYDTIANGKGLMQGYRTQIPPADRWAIVLYVRALQRSQGVSSQDVPEDKRNELKKGNG
ncbi:MAG: c-type cytochrome [Gemmataceae bacterium]